MVVRPVVVASAVLLHLSACATGMRGTVRGARSGGEVSGQLAVGLGHAGTAAVVVEPEVVVGGGEDGASIGGGVGADVIVEAPSSRIGMYVGPRFLASYDGRGAMHTGVEAGVLLVPLRVRHRTEQASEKGGFLFDGLSRSATRRIQLGLTARYETVERFDGVTPDETRVMFGATLSWTHISGHTEPARDDAPARTGTAPAVAPPTSQVVDELVATDPSHTLAALVAGLAADPSSELRIRSRTSLAWKGPVPLLAYDLTTGATIAPRLAVSYTLAADGTATRVTAHVASEPGDAHGPDAVSTWVRRFHESSAWWGANGGGELDPQPRMRVVIDTRTLPMRARTGDCAYDAALAADAIEEVFSVVTTPARTELHVHWLGAATQIRSPALPGLGLYDATVNFGLGQARCGPGAPEPARLDELTRVDGGGAYPRTVEAAQVAAAALVDPSFAADVDARRAEALEAIKPYAPAGDPIDATVSRNDTATWLTDPDRVRFTFVESARADDAAHTRFAVVSRTIAVDVDLGSTTAAPVIVSDTADRRDGRIVHP